MKKNQTIRLSSALSSSLVLSFLSSTLACAPGLKSDSNSSSDLRMDSQLMTATPRANPTPTPPAMPDPTPDPNGKIFEVGPNKGYASLSQVAPLLAPGDLVLVYSGTTYASQRFTRAGTAQNKIFIRGVRDANGNRPVISGGTNTIEAAADHYVFESLQITGGSSRCFFHHADDISIRDSKIFGCPLQGILGADDQSGSLTLEYVEVTQSGSGTQNHAIYMTTDQKSHPNAVFRMQHCYVHDNNGGNAIKSRAERNEIYYNWIDASLYRALELIGPDFDAGNVTPSLKREDSDVVGNVIRQTKSFYTTRIGGDKANSETNGRYRFVNNTFLISGTSAVFQVFLGVDSVEMHNNAFVKTGSSLNIFEDVDASWTTGRKIAGSNNWISSGASTVPPEWKQTSVGADPGFLNLNEFDLRLTANSPLLNTGSTTLASLPGSEFPRPLSLPAMLPPLKKVEMFDQALLRIRTNGIISIGAFER